MDTVTVGHKTFAKTVTGMAAAKQYAAQTGLPVMGGIRSKKPPLPTPKARQPKRTKRMSKTTESAT